MLGLSREASLRLRTLLQFPWLCRGLAGIPSPSRLGCGFAPVPLSTTIQHREITCWAGKMPSLTTAFILPTDTKLNQFSATTIFNKGHTE